MNTNSPKKSVRSYAGKSKMERHAERYEKLIEAGIEVIGTHGFAAASVKTICVEAGLTERYFYESFTNREDLLAQTYLAANERVKHNIEQALLSGNENSKEYLRIGVTAFYEVLEKDPRLGRILLFEAIERTGRLAELKREVEQNFVLNFKNALKMGNLSSNLSAEQETLIILGIFGAGVNIAMRWVLDDYRQSLEEVADSLIILTEAVYDKVCKSE